MQEKDLSEEHYQKIGELLSRAILNKEHAHPADLERAAVILHSVIQSGFLFYDTDLEAAIERSGQHYSDSVKKHLIQMIDNYNELVHGLDKSDYAQFKFEG